MKEELKRFNEQITKQDGMVEHKPRTDAKNYIYADGLSLFELQFVSTSCIANTRNQKKT